MGASVRLLSFALVVALAGCQGHDWILGVGDAARALLVVRLDGDDARVDAVDLAEEPARLKWMSDAAFSGRPGTVVVLGYDQTLARLGLKAGPLVVSRVGAPIPPWTQAWVVRPGDLEFTASATVAALVSDVRLADLRPAQACLDSRSCYGEADETCQLRCEPSFVADRESPASPEVVCPPGWEPRELDRLLGTACEPFAAVSWAPCGPGLAAYPGDAACHPIGADCPPGAFPSDLPPGALRVDVSAAPGGDGSAARPFRTIAEAVSAAPDGGLVALAVGTFAENVNLLRGVSLRGACASGTRIVSTPAAPGIFASLASTISDLSVIGGASGLRVGRGPVVVRGVSVERPSINGVFVAANGAVELHAVAIRSPGAIGISLSPGSSLKADHLEVFDAKATGVLVLNGHAELADTHISYVAQQGANPFGAGIEGRTATVSLRRVAVDHTESFGVLVTDGSLDAEDIWIRDVADLQEEDAGLSLGRAKATIRRASIYDVAHAGVRVVDEAVAEVTDTIVGGLVGDPEQLMAGFFCDDASMSLARVVARTSGNGAQILDPPTVKTSTIVDAHFIGTSTAPLARAALTVIGANVRVHLERVNLVGGPNGMRVEAGQVEATDLTISESFGTGGIDLGARGITLLRGGQARLTRAAVLRSGLVGVVLTQGSSLEAENFVVGDPLGTEPVTTAGMVINGAHLSLRRFRVEGIRGAGVELGNGTSTLYIRDGLFIGNQIAVSLPSSVDPGVFLHRVRYQENVVDWSVRP